jgi:protein-S-isoprenylcysteine O-methyltransferase Ste14
MHESLTRRAFRRWAEQILPGLAGIAVVAAIVGLVTHHLDVRWWTWWAGLCIISTGAFSLRWYWRTRRRERVESDQG